jgi:hypothetical protein
MGFWKIKFQLVIVGLHSIFKLFRQNISKKSRNFVELNAKITTP